MRARNIVTPPSGREARLQPLVAAEHDPNAGDHLEGVLGIRVFATCFLFEIPMRGFPIQTISFETLVRKQKSNTQSGYLFILRCHRANPWHKHFVCLLYIGTESHSGRLFGGMSAFNHYLTRRADLTDGGEKPCEPTANLRTKLLSLRGFDSSRILTSRGGILISLGESQKS